MAFRKLTLGGAAIFKPADLGNSSGVAVPPSTAAGITGNDGDMSGSGGGAGNWASNIKNLQVLASQADCNEKAGRLLAASNYKYVELRITSPANYLGVYDIVPSLGFYEWGLADALFKRGLSLNGKNLICRSVTANMVADGVMQTSIVFEIEAIGEDGIPGNYPAGYPTPITTTPTNGPSPIYAGGAFLTVYDGSLKAAFIRGDRTVNAGTTIHASTYYDKPVIALSTTTALVVPAGANKLYGIVLSLNLDAITPGALSTYVNATVMGRAAIDKIDSTKALIGYTQSSAPLYNAKANIATVSVALSSVGTPVLLDAEVVASGESEPTIGVATLSTTTGIACWLELKAAPTTHAIYGRVLGLTTDPPTAGAYYEIASFANIISGTINVIGLTSSLAVVFYKSTDGKMYANALGVSGTAITVGAAKEIFATADDPYGQRYAAKATNTTFVVTNGDSNVQVVAGSVAGLVITLGVAVQLLPGDTGANSCVAVSGNNVCVVYSDGGGLLQRRTLTISGTTLTDFDDDTTNSESWPGGADGGGLCVVQ